MATITYQGGLSVDEVRNQVKAEQIHKLSSNENPRGPSPLVIKAIQEAALELNSYPPRSDDALRQALVDAYDWGLALDHFVCTNSGSRHCRSSAALSPGGR
ncbi:MAG: hypothetical protein R2911_46410 [Caldilineaceae bacterium]